VRHHGCVDNASWLLINELYRRTENGPYRAGRPLPSAMKVLIISQYYVPDITAAAFRVQETVELLRSRGHGVRVITARPHKAQVAGARAEVDPPGIVRTPIVKYRGGGKANYLLHYVSFMVNAFLAAIFRGGSADVVWATSPPLFVALAGWAAARVRRVPFVLDVRDIWPDSAVVTGQITRTGLMYRCAKRVESWIYRHSDAITCVAQPMGDYIREHAPAVPITVVYNGVPAQMLESTIVDERKPTDDQATINLAYVGNFGYCQDLQLLLSAAKRLRTEGVHHVKFTLVGSGVENEKLRSFVGAEQLTGVSIRDPVPKAEALRIVQDASALFLQLKDDGTMEKTIPSKVFDYMVAGRPVVYGIEGEGRTILERSGGNLYFQPGSLDDLVETLKRLANELPRLEEQARQNKAIVASEFTREQLVDRLVTVFKRVTSETVVGEPL
jgi:glycosyltransferase involved in cell wall biosynthesis